MTAGQAGSGWLVPLADLSLILFIIAGAGIAGTQSAISPQDRREEKASGFAAEGIASTIYVATGDDRSALADWLAQLQPGPGEQLTVLGSYTQTAGRAAIVAQSEALAREALAAGFAPRVIVQEGSRVEIMAYLAHDRMPAMARDLLNPQEHRAE